MIFTKTFLTSREQHFQCLNDLSMSSPFEMHPIHNLDDHIFRLIYEILLVVFLILFITIFLLGRSEYRPFTHRQFRRIRICTVVSVFGYIAATVVHILWESRVMSCITMIFNSLSDVVMTLIITNVIRDLIRDYFASHRSQSLPLIITRCLYFYCCFMISSTLCQLLLNSFEVNMRFTIYRYFYFAQIAVNGLMDILLLIFITLFTRWLMSYHRIHSFKDSVGDTVDTPSDLSFVRFGGEQDHLVSVYFGRHIGLLSGFSLYFGIVVASNIYVLDEHQHFILLHCIGEKFVLLSTLAVYLWPRADNYLSASPKILNELPVDTTSSKKHKRSSFKDPNASEQWDFYSRNDGQGGEEQYEDWDNESNVSISYSTLMYRQDQKLARSAPKTKTLRNWASYFSPANSPGWDSKKERLHSQGGRATAVSYDEVQSITTSIASERYNP